MKWIVLLLAIIGGWCLGAFLNFLVDALFASRAVKKAGCPNCQQPRNFLDYLALRSCRSCGQARSRRTWMVQIASTVLLPLFWLFPPPRFGFWITLPYMVYFAVVFIMDVEERVVLHEISITGAILAIPLGICWNGWLKTLIGAAAGFGIMLALYYFGILFNKVLSRRRGEEIEEVALGYGDVNLSGVLGILLGWPKIGISLFFSVLAGGVFSGLYLLVAVLLKKYRAFSAIPYAPFLVVIAVVLIYLA